MPSKCTINRLNAIKKLYYTLGYDRQCKTALKSQLLWVLNDFIQLSGSEASRLTKLENSEGMPRTIEIYFLIFKWNGMNNFPGGLFKYACTQSSSSSYTVCAHKRVSYMNTEITLEIYQLYKYMKQLYYIFMRFIEVLFE